MELYAAVRPARQMVHEVPEAAVLNWHLDYNDDTDYHVPPSTPSHPTNRIGTLAWFERLGSASPRKA